MRTGLENSSSMTAEIAAAGEAIQTSDRQAETDLTQRLDDREKLFLASKDSSFLIRIYPTILTKGLTKGQDLYKGHPLVLTNLTLTMTAGPVKKKAVRVVMLILSDSHLASCSLQAIVQVEPQS